MSNKDQSPVGRFNSQGRTKAFTESHANADTDFEPNSMHHTLGKGPMQAARGNHIHDDRYFTETESNANFSAIGHNHAGVYSPVGHDHNGTYQEQDVICKVYHTTLATLTTGVVATLNFDTEEVDPLNMHAAGTPANIVVPSAGRYDIKAQVAFVNNAAGHRVVGIAVNGTLMPHTRYMASPTTNHVQQCFGELLLAANDIVTVQVVQTSGGNLNTITGQHVTWVSVKKTGDV